MKLVLCLLWWLLVFPCNAQVSDFSYINLKKADSVARAYQGAKLSNLPQLSYQLTADLTTDVERFRALYMWVCQNIANDYRLYLKNDHKRQRFKDDSLKLKAWNDTFKVELFKKMQKRKRTICTGYAYLVKTLADFADIPCEIVQGYGKTSTTDIDKLTLPNHTWNAVKLNNKWYLCDATWASGTPNPETNLFQFNYNDGFFLTNPELFAINHFPVEKKWLLLEDSSYNYEVFLENPILYNSAYLYLDKHLSPKKLLNKVKRHSQFTFEYTLLKPVDLRDVSLLIDNGTGSKTVRPELILKDKKLTLTHLFNHTGLYDVHFMIGAELISTYTIEVER
ncbi:MAG TPA: transglutaminase domain-containing protein [Flavobacteriaceae bacterium]|nr:transglutaminase domain-containing protein [Flavobacteriaceae bacterium]